MTGSISTTSTPALALLKEGEFDLPWLPAVTAGVHYKYNDSVEDIDDDLAGTLGAIGIEDDSGVDFTLYATKMFPDLYRPLLVDVGLRATESAHLGLLGFTGDYNYLPEGNAVVFLTDNLLAAVEYRMKPDEYKHIPELVENEDDWWTICACYIINEHTTVSAGYGKFRRHPQPRSQQLLGAESEVRILVLPVQAVFLQRPEILGSSGLFILFCL